MGGFTKDEPRFFGPVKEVLEHVSSLIPQGARVLDVGPGDRPFARATDFVDYVQRGKLPITICDLSSEHLPFPDKSFDFVYCRQVLEDMHNPFLLLKEMQRVGKAGYIENPSPVAELCRGIGGSEFCGYHHHRFIVWVEDGQLRFVSKYPIVEYVKTQFVRYDGSPENPDWIADILRSGPVFWNTYYLWQDKINWRHMQDDVDFHMIEEYGDLLCGALAQSLRSTDLFIANVLKAINGDQHSTAAA